MSGQLPRQRRLTAVMGAASLASAAVLVLVGPAATAYAHPLEYHAAVGSAFRFPVQLHAGLVFDPYGTKAVQGAQASHTNMAQQERGAVAETAASTLNGSSRNVELVSKLRLTRWHNGIADVSYHDGFAYLSAWAEECPDRGGVHVVDVRDPANPKKVGFLPAQDNAFVGEGLHVFEHGGRDILVHNLEPCSVFATLGVRVWDVTNPTAPAYLGTVGDNTPRIVEQTYHSVHSVQGFSWQNRAYAVAQDNFEAGTKDVDIFDITPLLSGQPGRLVSESGLPDWPGAAAGSARNNQRFHHDMQQKVIRRRNLLAVSYWDAGQVLLDISDPAQPRYITDSNYPETDPEFAPVDPEGNSHQSYWDQDGDWLLSSDEDFDGGSRGRLEITSGPNVGGSPSAEFAYTVPIPTAGFSSTGGTVWGGSGCDSDQNGNGTSDRTDMPQAASTGSDTVVLGRGGCNFTEKIRSAEMAGYKMVLIGQSHAGAADDQEAVFTGTPPNPPEQWTAHTASITHGAMHRLFADEPFFEGPEGFATGGDMPAIGARGADVLVRMYYDGPGYVRLHNASKPSLPVVDTYVVEEAKDPSHSSLSVHEVKTDPRPAKDLAYFSYYSAGLRVATFGENGIHEVGHFTDQGGNSFWGVFPMCIAKCADKTKRPYLLLSDMHFGLYVLRYTGKE